MSSLLSRDTLLPLSSLPELLTEAQAVARTSIRAWILAHEDESDDLSALAARPSCVARLGELARGERLPPAAAELAPIFQGAS